MINVNAHSITCGESVVLQAGFYRREPSLSRHQLISRSRWGVGRVPRRARGLAVLLLLAPRAPLERKHLRHACARVAKRERLVDVRHHLRSRRLTESASALCKRASDRAHLVLPPMVEPVIRVAQRVTSMLLCLRTAHTAPALRALGHPRPAWECARARAPDAECAPHASSGSRSGWRSSRRIPR